MTIYKYRLDFEIGTLIKSPCKGCDKRQKDFPECVDKCELLNKIQLALSETRSCSRG